MRGAGCKCPAQCAQRRTAAAGVYQPGPWKSRASLFRVAPPAGRERAIPAFVHQGIRRRDQSGESQYSSKLAKSSRALVRDWQVRSPARILRCSTISPTNGRKDSGQSEIRTGSMTARPRATTMASRCCSAISISCRCLRTSQAYKLIVAPNLRLVDDATVERLRAFVAGGGILVLNYRAGTQYMDASMRRVLPPGVFTEIAGVTTDAKLDLVDYSGIADQFEISFTGTETDFRPRTILESLTLHGAETIASFRGGRMAGRPAITRNRHGQGWVFYVGTDSADDLFHEALARAVAATGKLAPLIAAPYGVEVTSREDANTIYYFLLNLTEDEHNSIPLPHPMVDVIAERDGVTKCIAGTAGSSRTGVAQIATDPTRSVNTVRQPQHYRRDRGWTGERSTSWRALPHSQP